MRRRTKPAKTKVQGKQPRAGKSPKTDDARVRDLEMHLAKALKDRAEALDQQTAIAEILRVISSSVTDPQSVFDTIVKSAVRLCGGTACAVLTCDDEFIHVRAQVGENPETRGAVQSRFPVPLNTLNRDSLVGRVVLDGQVVHVPDFEVPEAAPEGARTVARMVGYRSALFTPMFRDGRPIGLITVGRRDPGPFSEEEMRLMGTFADQAVIAIENVRLFTELEARNRDLTATSEILQVISRSPTDVEPVFTAIAKSAAHLIGAVMASVYEFDGSLIHLRVVVPDDWSHADDLRRNFPTPPARNFAAGRVILDRAVLHRADLQNDSDTPELTQALAGRMRLRGVLWVPMLRDGEPLGVIGVAREESALFSDEQVRLLQTFADQAVIAIENVRLFKELQEKNHALTAAHAQVTNALEQQTATSEILQVISQSPTETQPVFETIVHNAASLCASEDAVLFLLDGAEMVVHAQEGAIGGVIGDRQPIEGTVGGRTVSSQRVVHIEDLAAADEFPAGQEICRRFGHRTILSVPLVRKGVALGAIMIRRTEVRPFSDQQVALLQTFADQAVIAIENVRLFKELEARTGELTRSVDQLTALGEISQAVSSTLDVETVLQTIVSRASQLAGADGCAIYEYDDATEAFHIRATHNLDPALVETLRAAPLRKGEGAMGRAAETREPTQVADIAAPGAYQSHIRDTLLGAGYRALLSVPLLREGKIIGSLSLNRHTPGAFPPEAVEVLKTFATQSALAIQNARLFREIGDKSRQLEAASRHKSEFLANMSHELRTPLNAVIGFSEVLLQRMFGALNDKQDEYLKDIYASGQHLLSLINDILDLSKIEAGRMELVPALFHLPSALDNAVTLVRERAARHGIALHLDLDPRLGELVGDERKVKQVLLNLLSNAVKFTSEGGQISLKASRRDGAVEVAVTDTGIGIAHEDQAAIFEEFRQVGSDETRKQEGTGLGLTLAKKFVELHGGRIWVESEVGRGSTFTFTLPVS